MKVNPGGNRNSVIYLTMGVATLWLLMDDVYGNKYLSYIVNYITGDTSVNITDKVFEKNYNKTIEKYQKNNARQPNTGSSRPSKEKTAKTYEQLAPPFAKHNKKGS